MKNQVKWKVYRTPLWKRIKYTPIYFYFQYKFWRKDGCGILLAIHHAFWFTKFMLI